MHRYRIMEGSRYARLPELGQKYFNKLVAWLENGGHAGEFPVEFCMNDWSTPPDVLLQTGHCGTSACLGGFIEYAMHADKVVPFGWEMHLDKERIGLSEEEFDALFYPTLPDEEGIQLSYDTVSAEAALVAVLAFLETGEPDWSEVEGYAG